MRAVLIEALCGLMIEFYSCDISHGMRSEHIWGVTVSLNRAIQINIYLLTYLLLAMSYDARCRSMNTHKRRDLEACL